MKQPKASPKFMREFYFWTGIVATVAYRIIIILNFYSSFWVKISWYIGTIGFVIYFIHRYQIAEKRDRLIEDNNMVQKVDQVKELSEKDKAIMRYIFKTLSSSKAKYNYYAIFALSGLAFILGIIFDFVIK
ncbi:MAG: hypothetical protein U5L76_00970 [Patescibacteria group bacterium]|nr:hypothetical protein [Patescibacteria group bacterium]